jgi:Ran GTPase-activating protein (RanGAP) involved in mRNA processing and transport
MKSFSTIHLFQNGIKEEGMSELIKSFASNPDLSHLKLNDNWIKDSAPILIETLPLLKNLQVLDISDSLLGHAHSVNIFKTLTCNCGIKQIFCNYNEIEKKSSQKAIFELCLTMPSLEIVTLKGNDIDPSLWKKFRKDLKNKIKNFEPYSDEEEVQIEEEEDLIDELDKLEIK